MIILQSVLILTFIATTSAQNIFKKVKAEISLLNSCEFYNSINITDGVINADQSITHNHVNYSIFQYKDFDYIYDDNNTQVNVPEHKRGCVCLVKTCIRLCCIKGQKYNFENKKCERDSKITKFYVAIQHMQLENKSIRHDLYDDGDEIVGVYGRTCDEYTEWYGAKYNLIYDSVSVVQIIFR